MAWSFKSNMEFCLCAFTEKPKPTSLKVLNWVNPIQRSDSPFPSGPVEAESHRHSESERSYVCVQQFCPSWRG